MPNRFTSAADFRQDVAYLLKIWCYFNDLKDRLMEEDAVLIVVSEEPERLIGMEAVKEGWLEVVSLKDFLYSFTRDIHDFYS